MSDQPSKATTPDPEPEHTALKPMSSTSMTEEGIVYLDGVKHAYLQRCSSACFSLRW